MNGRDRAQGKTAPTRYAPVSARVSGLLHGADYNPDQWLDSPGILTEDLRLMAEARINTVSLGIFSWSSLEPEDGVYRFEWLDRVMDALAAHAVQVILATPTGSRPPWMARAWPEVLRVGPDRRRNLYGLRHNHCYTSPVFRGKAEEMNRRLAERYGPHPALIMWHASNEYGGECHCGLCQEAFRSWLKRRYGELGALNRAWWTSFWGHAYSRWEEIESPAPHGEPYLHGLNLDWKRFVTDQTVEFLEAEIAPLRALAPGIPVTTNLMGTYPGLNYARLAPPIDVVSWDSYPCWHGTGKAATGSDSPFRWDPEGRDWMVAADTAFGHDLMRSLKGGKPFMLMESTPSFSSWHPVRKLKRPGMHAVSSLLAVAHGSDTVQYFQWRASRGGFEKLHGAVVDHEGSGRTRTFREVAALGETLSRLGGIAGTTVPSETAVIFDWENGWALANDSLGRAKIEGVAGHPGGCGGAADGSAAGGSAGYERTCKRHYYPLWAMGVPVDVIDSERDLSPYRLVAAPLLSMVRPGVPERLEELVRRGGTLVTTCRTGMVDQHDLCFLGGFPGPLRKLLGVWAEETDELYPGESNGIVPAAANELGLEREYRAFGQCDVLQAETAEVVATFKEDFYRGRPAITVNRLGKGRAFTIACDCEDGLLSDFYGFLCRDLRIRRALDANLPRGVSAHVRTDGERDFIFLFNFTDGPREVSLPEGEPLRDAVSGEQVTRALTLQGFGFTVLQRAVAVS